MNIPLYLRTSFFALALVCLPAAIAQPRVTAVVNGSSFDPAVSPSSFATIFGEGLAGSTAAASTATLPLDLGGVSVTVSGRPAPLFYVSATQINFQVPLATPPGQASVVVRVNGANSPIFRFPVAAAAPGILAFGANQAVVQHLDGTLVTSEDPANPGMPAVIYLTGIGAVSNPVSDGAPAPLSPLSYASLPHSVTVGGKDAPVVFLGLTPGFIGLAQANITVPDLAPGNHPVILTAGGKQSSANAPVLAVDNAPTLQSLSTNAGVPGTRITLLGTSLPSGTQLRSVLVQFEDGGLVPAAPDSSSGEPTFYVPFIPDPEAPLGYRTGACTIAIYNGKTISNALPFQIDVLPTPADAISRLKSIVRGFASTSQRTIALQKAIPEFAPLAEAIEPLSLARTNALLALADQVAANGRATVPLDLGGPANAGAPTFEVTLRDVQNLIGVLDQAKADGTQVATVTLPPAHADGPKPCLFDLPGYQYCTILTQSPDAYGEGDGSGPLFRLLNSAFTVGPQIFNNRRVLCTFNRSAVTPTLVATHLLQYLNDRRLTCKLQPTKPVSLTALPAPNPIPAGSFESTGNRGTQVNIRLEPFWTPEFTVDQILESRYTDTVLHAMPFPDQCLHDLGGDLTRMAGDIFNRARGQLLDALKKLAPVPFREVPLYKCDVTDVQPSNGHPSIVRYRSDKNDDSMSRWGIEGTQSGTTRVAVHPIWDHFLPDTFAIDPSDHCPSVLGGPLKPGLFGDFRPIDHCVTVSVAGSEKALEVASTQVFSYTTREGPRQRKVYSPPQRVTQSSLFAEADSSLSAVSTLTIEQTAENKWRMVQEVEGAPASVSEVIDTWNQVRLRLINHPGPRLIRAHIVSNVSGSCQGMDATLVGQTIDTQLDEGNNGCANDWTLTTYSNSGASAAGASELDIGVFILGGKGPGFGSGKGNVTTEIELLDEPPQ